jgi:hypothetical protein
MTRARAVSFGAFAAVIAVDVALLATWAFLVSLGVGGGNSADAEALAEPSLLLVLAAVVFATLAYGRTSMAALAAVQLAAAAAASAGVEQLALSSDFWSGPFILLFAAPPALFLAGGACALVEFLKRAVAASGRGALVAGDADSSAEATAVDEASVDSRCVVERALRR